MNTQTKNINMDINDMQLIINVLEAERAKCQTKIDEAKQTVNPFNAYEMETDAGYQELIAERDAYDRIIKGLTRNEEHSGKVLCALLCLRDRRSDEIIEEEWHKVESERMPRFGDMVHFNCEDKAMITAVAYKPYEETRTMWTIGDAPDDFGITWFQIIARPEIEKEEAVSLF